MLVVAIAAFADDVVFEQDFGGSGTHEVGHGDAAYIPLGHDGVDFVADDADGVLAAGTEVDLWGVDICDVGVEVAVQDLWRGLSIGRRADGSALVQHEVAVLYDGVAVENVDHCIAVVTSEIHELHIVECHFGFDDFDAGAIGEIHLFYVASHSVLEPYFEMFRFIETVELHPVASGIGTNHGSVDGEEDCSGIDTRNLVVDDQHVVGGDGKVGVDEKTVWALGDRAVGDVNQIGQGIGGAVAGADPLGVQNRC